MSGSDREVNFKDRLLKSEVMHEIYLQMGDNYRLIKPFSFNDESFKTSKIKNGLIRLLLRKFDYLEWLSDVSLIIGLIYIVVFLVLGVSVLNTDYVLIFLKLLNAEYWLLPTFIFIGVYLLFYEILLTDRLGKEMSWEVTYDNTPYNISIEKIKTLCGSDVNIYPAYSEHNKTYGYIKANIGDEKIEIYFESL